MLKLSGLTPEPDGSIFGRKITASAARKQTAAAADNMIMVVRFPEYHLDKQEQQRILKD